MSLCPYCEERPLLGCGIFGKAPRTCGDKACQKKHGRVATKEWKSRRSPAKVAFDRRRAKIWRRLYVEDYELLSCPEYKKRKNASSRKWRKIRKDSGICVECRKAPVETGRIRCRPCLDIDAARLRAYRKSEKYFEWIARCAERERVNDS